MRKTEIICRIIFLFLRSFPIRRKGTKGATKGKGRLRFRPFPLESNPHRFVCANIAIKPPDDTVIFVRTYHGITPNILLTQYIPSLPAGARLPAAFRTLRSAWLFRPFFCEHSILLGFFIRFALTKN